MPLLLTADPTFLTQAHQAKQELIRAPFRRWLPGFDDRRTRSGGGQRPGSRLRSQSYCWGGRGGPIAHCVYVRAKLPASALSSGQAVPSVVNGVPTDVVPVGDVAAFLRPTDCGVSIGHRSITAGTLGCLVQKTSPGSGDRYVLSNNHVLADCNAGAVGNDVLEPGPSDGGTTPIANLSEWESLQFGGPVNHMDAAIAQLINRGDVNTDILTIGGVVLPAMLPSLYQSVRKQGRTTLHTVGVIMDVSADLWVGYGTKRAWFEDQIAVAGVGGPFRHRAIRAPSSWTRCSVGPWPCFFAAASA